MLNQPLTLPNGHVLKNRICKAAMTEGLADKNDNATERHITLYKTWAEGGAALLISGNIMVDKRYLERSGNVVAEDESGLAQLSAWASAVGNAGSQLWAQISHPGRQCPRLANLHPLAPSEVQLNMVGNFGRPRAASEAEIQNIIRRFARTAAIVKKAGFHGVQIHAAHGYLISQFLSPLTNLRDDQWGGPLHNRARLLLEIIRAVRAEVGVAFPISVKLNSADFQKGGFSAADCQQVVGWLNTAGVDLLEISGGTYEQLVFMQPEEMRASTQKREAYFLEYAREIKKIARMPVMVTGGFRSLAGMQSALEAGDTDMLGIARPFCLIPDLANQLMAGQLSTLPHNENQLVLGKGYFGPASKSKSLQALNNQSQAGWYYHQIELLAAGLSPRIAYSPRRALFSHLNKDFMRAMRRKFAKRNAA
ncbi:MAG: NADH:flavin oxidoreductase/NADH oxidase family protein [Oceanospirillaceae bacterium]|nr:NADH:flavin oxidoreductase/NADH oxidase family protein [Oceanospirillaceae bacterium]MCP5349819.1 NADH:flavin oxidoreductase/NADH oxidase family protein [Oceanospirillaceae bacterium]